MQIQLKDPTLLRQQCYIDGEWVDADDGATIAVTNPADRRGARHRADGRRRDRAAPSRPPNARWPAWRAKTGQGALGHPAQAGST